MEALDLGSKWKAAAMPNPPSPYEVKSSRKKEMALTKLKQQFDRVGVVHYSGKDYVYITAPTPQQEKKLKEKGLDVSSERLFRPQAH